MNKAYHTQHGFSLFQCVCRSPRLVIDQFVHVLLKEFPGDVLDLISVVQVFRLGHVGDGPGCITTPPVNAEQQGSHGFVGMGSDSGQSKTPFPRILFVFVTRGH